MASCSVPQREVKIEMELPYNENNYFTVDLADVGFTADNWEFDVPFENCRIVGEPCFEMSEDCISCKFTLTNVKIIDITTNKVILEWDMREDDENVDNKT